MIRNKLREKIGEQQSVYEALKSGGDSQVCYQEFQNGEWGTDDANYTNRLRLACYEDAHAHNSMENQISTYKHFIPAGNEPSGHACMHIWRLPRGSKTPLLCSAASLILRCLQRGL